LVLAKEHDLFGFDATFAKLVDDFRGDHSSGTRYQDILILEFVDVFQRGLVLVEETVFGGGSNTWGCLLWHANSLAHS